MDIIPMEFEWQRAILTNKIFTTYEENESILSIYFYMKNSTKAEL
jgi:hypothetical protein